MGINLSYIKGAADGNFKDSRSIAMLGEVSYEKCKKSAEKYLNERIPLQLLMSKAERDILVNYLASIINDWGLIEDDNIANSNKFLKQMTDRELDAFADKICGAKLLNVIEVVILLGKAAYDVYGDNSNNKVKLLHMTFNKMKPSLSPEDAKEIKNELDKDMCYWYPASSPTFSPSISNKYRAPSARVFKVLMSE